MNPQRKVLPLDKLRLEFQPEHVLMGETLEDVLIEDNVLYFVERLRLGEKVPRIRVRFDGEHYWVEDGFHRVAASRRLGLKKIDAVVRPGTLADMEAEWQQGLIKLHKALAKEAAQRERRRKHEQRSSDRK